MRSYFNVDTYILQLEQAENISQCDSVPLPDIADNQNYLFISYAHQDYYNWSSIIDFSCSIMLAYQKVLITYKMI